MAETECYVLMRSDGSCMENGAGGAILFHSMEEALARRDKANSWTPKNPYHVMPANFAKEIGDDWGMKP